MIKVLTLVISCRKNKALWKDILEKEITNMIIVCGGELETDFLLEGKILFLNCKDTYDGLPEKIVCAHTAISRLHAFDEITHILKIDDHDTTVTEDCIKKLEKHGSSLLMNNPYIGQHIYSKCIGGHHIGMCPGSNWNNRLYEGDSTPYASGGFSYILDRFASRKIVEEYSIYDLESIREQHIYEDLMVALILKKHNIEPIKAYYGVESTDVAYRNLVPVEVKISFLSLSR